MAAYIKERDMDVVFYGECKSACANYIFLAAGMRLLVGEVAPQWHGSVILDEKIAAPTDYGFEPALLEYIRFLQSFGPERAHLFNRLINIPPAGSSVERQRDGYHYAHGWSYPEETLCSEFKIGPTVRIRP